MQGKEAKLVGSVMLTLVVMTAACRADSAGWTDEFRLRFPEALLLQPPMVSNHPALLPEVSGSSEIPGIAHISSFDVQNADGQLSLSQVAQPASFKSMTSAPQAFPGQYSQAASHHAPPCSTWQVLPAGIMYPSYIAGEKESRMSAAVLEVQDRGTILEETIGGRMGLLRYGTPGPFNPQGWQWDVEGAALLRQDIDHELDVEAVDFRVGTLITYQQGQTVYKAGYYHLSSHVGDEYLVRNIGFQRINYVRDSVIIGVYHHVTPGLAVYGEVAYAFKTDGGAEPLEIQFGSEYTSPNAILPRGAPFVAVNYHGRQEFDFGGGFNALAGWEWIGPTSNHRVRIGGRFYSGKETQWSFFDEDITMVGAGIWYDF
ncbi:MAG: DUF1207 domain-containing protein [Planctomycetaceae bacterium]